MTLLIAANENPTRTKFNQLHPNFRGTLEQKLTIVQRKPRRQKNRRVFLVQFLTKFIVCSEDSTDIIFLCHIIITVRIAHGKIIRIPRSCIVDT